MKNITVSVSDNAYLEARIWAAAHGTSISAIVQHSLEHLPNLKWTAETVMDMARMRQEALAKDKKAAASSKRPAQTPAYRAFHAENEEKQQEAHRNGETLDPSNEINNMPQ